jgi:hypothetical protein
MQAAVYAAACAFNESPATSVIPQNHGFNKIFLFARRKHAAVF